MQINMTSGNLAALFGSMLVLAAIPSLSVLTVVARSISSGFLSGLVTVIGIVIGDIIFIILAIYGLSAIAETTVSSLLVLIKYFGGAYLIWMGILLGKSKPNSTKIKKIEESSWLSCLSSGLFITLGDQKAIFFYISFFPAFIDLKSVTIADTIIIVFITIIAVGGVKLIYAYLADKARLFLQSSKIQKGINFVAATLMISTGIFLIAKN